MEDKQIRPAYFTEYSKKWINQNWQEWFFGKSINTKKEQEAQHDSHS